MKKYIKRRFEKKTSKKTPHKRPRDPKKSPVCLKISRTSWQLQRKKLFCISRVKKIVKGEAGFRGKKNAQKNPRTLKALTRVSDNSHLYSRCMMEVSGKKSYKRVNNAKGQNYGITNDPRVGKLRTILLFHLGVRSYHRLYVCWKMTAPDKLTRKNKIDIGFDYQPYAINFSRIVVFFIYRLNSFYWE